MGNLGRPCSTERKEGKEGKERWQEEREGGSEGGPEGRMKEKNIKRKEKENL